MRKNDMYPSVIKVIPKGDYNIFVEFDNNECGILNMEPYLNFGVFHKIKDPNIFAKVRISFDTVEWENGIDLDPQFVYEKSIKKECLTSG